MTSPFTHGLVVGVQVALDESNPLWRTDADALRLAATQLRSIAVQLADEAKRWECHADGEGRPIEKAYPVDGHLQVSVNFAKVYQSSHRLSAAKSKPEAKARSRQPAKGTRRKTRSRTRPTRRKTSSRSRATTQRKAAKRRRSGKR